MISGVTSGVAALAWGGIPATHRRESVRLNLLTAHEAIKTDGPQVRWDLLAKDEHATLVGYMGVSALPRVVANLLDAGMEPLLDGAIAGTRFCYVHDDTGQVIEIADVSPQGVAARVARGEAADDWDGTDPVRVY